MTVTVDLSIFFLIKATGIFFERYAKFSNIQWVILVVISKKYYDYRFQNNQKV